MKKNSAEQNENAKGIKVYIPLIVVIIIVLLGGWYWYYEFSKYISTDDAHVDSDNVSISSKYLGRIIHLYAQEGDSLKTGMLLVELDSSDLIAQRNHVIAIKQQSIAMLSQSQARYNYDQQSIIVLKVNVEKTKEDLDRANDQIQGDVISKEQFEHIKKAFESAQAQYEAAQAQLKVSFSQIETAASSIESSKAQINIVETQLSNTRLYAPFDGIIAKRWLLSGDITQPGQAIYTLTNNKNLWVIVYIEETKISNIYLQQKARFTIDAFPGINFMGKIFYIGSNTASQFSLIPPNNASGNFTKVTQRVPLKISIDDTDNKKGIAFYKVLSGMSAVVKIIKK